MILTAESGMHCGASILHTCGGDPWFKVCRGVSEVEKVYGRFKEQEIV